jgi:carboxypeptidase C (cathepsin A)
MSLHMSLSFVCALQACGPAQTYCNVKLTSPYSKSGLNVYDIRHHCDDPPLCYDFSAIDKFLSNPDTQKVRPPRHGRINTGVAGVVVRCRV